MSKDIQRNFVFKNVMAYRIGPNWNATVPEIEAALSANRFTECTPGQDKSVGWTEPRNVANGPLLESIGGQWIAKLLIETKAVPSSVVKRKAEIQAQDIPGWLVSSYAGLTVALDITLTDDLKNEGLARELVNRLQNARKDQGLDVTDRILVSIDTDENTWNALEQYKTYICNEILADSLRLEQGLQNATLLI